MASWEDVSRACLALPEATEQLSGEGTRAWRVRDKLFAWERPLRRKDLAELGAAAPDGPVLAARVPDEGAKAALIAEEPDVYFTTAHFAGYPAILCRLDALAADALEELVAEAWACRAPKRLLAEHPAGAEPRPSPASRARTLPSARRPDLARPDRDGRTGGRQPGAGRRSDAVPSGGAPPKRPRADPPFGGSCL